MSHFAKIDSNNIVTEVIVAEAEFFDTFVDSSPGIWIETSYNGTIRKNYAGIGMTYDSTRDAFIPPKLYASWTLNESTCQWEPPVAYPDTSKEYRWNEDTTSWKEIE
jgi:hypothetical protein